ncbi:MAG: PDZ domain-containing protein [Desulfobacteraceae bacterium]|nr:PDZ domain-containing protein [Desulfobacteraceae bacterium]
MYKQITATKIVFSADARTTAPGKTKSSNGKQNVKNKNVYAKINNRNLFKVLVKGDDAQKILPAKESKSEEVLPVEASSLDVRLWGTVTGPEKAYAVIEDKKSKEQSLYEQGDVIQGATVKQILRNKVIITLNGVDQLLEIEIEAQKKSSRPPKRSGKQPKQLEVQYDQLEESFSGPLKDQIKTRPYFSDGEPDGLMVYGIKPKSIFRKIGLKNGDIIKDINGTPIVKSEDAQELYTSLEEPSNAKVTLIRRGEKKELIYHYKNGMFTITTYP